MSCRRPALSMIAWASSGQTALPLMSISTVDGSTPSGTEPQHRSGWCVSLYQCRPTGSFPPPWINTHGAYNRESKRCATVSRSPTR